MKKRIVFVIVILAFGHLVQADPVDLSSWNALNLDFPAEQGSGNWIVSGDNLSVTQTINADPSFFLNNLNQTSYSMDGTWQVSTARDDDYIGVVFGYQNSSNFYSFDWKQGDQYWDGTTAHEGMTIKKMTGATGDALVDLSLHEFWENGVNYGGMEVLAQNHGSGEGWVDNVLYDFHLDFNLNPGEIHIIVEQGGTTLWDHTLTDTTFLSGEFGFFNNSQEIVTYAGFDQTGGVVVPVPGAVLLGMIGLSAVGMTLRKYA